LLAPFLAKDQWWGLKLDNEEQSWIALVAVVGSFVDGGEQLDWKKL